MKNEKFIDKVSKIKADIGKLDKLIEKNEEENKKLRRDRDEKFIEILNLMKTYGNLSETDITDILCSSVKNPSKLNRPIHINQQV